jgi:hypothetical protein
MKGLLAILNSLIGNKKTNKELPKKNIPYLLSLLNLKKIK